MKNKVKILIPILLLVVFSSNELFALNSSNYTNFFKNKDKKVLVGGKILNSDTKKPVAFAQIFINGSNKGFIANEYGIYKISVNTGDKLVFKSLGYKTKVIEVPNINNEDYYLDVFMEQVAFQLDEVNVISLGTWEQFKHDFVHMKLPENPFLEQLTDRLTSGIMAAINSNEYQYVKKYGKTQEVSDGMLCFNGIGGGIGIQLGPNMAKRRSEKRVKLKNKRYSNFILSNKISEEVLIKLTKEKNKDRLNDFLIYFNSKVDLANISSNVSTIKLLMLVKDKYEEYLILHPKEKNVKSDTIS